MSGHEKLDIHAPCPATLHDEQKEAGGIVLGCLEGQNVLGGRFFRQEASQCGRTAIPPDLRHVLVLLMFRNLT